MLDDLEINYSGDGIVKSHVMTHQQIMTESCPWMLDLLLHPQ